MMKGHFTRRQRRAREKALEKLAQDNAVRKTTDSKKDSEIHPEPLSTPLPKPISNPPSKPAQPTQNEPIQNQKMPIGFRQKIEQSSLTDRLIVAFTGLLVIVGWFQFKTMDGQQKTMNNQLVVMKNDERAWIKIEPKQVSPIAVNGQQPLDFPLKISNIGKTPAEKIELGMRLEFADTTTGLPNDCRHAIVGVPCLGNATSWPIFFPNTDTDITATRVTYGGTDGVKWLVTDSEARAWEEGRMFIVVSGKVEYDDVFKDHHTYDFCFWTAHLAGNYAAKRCTDYNKLEPIGSVRVGDVKNP
jgi:hypothetical protein